MIHDRSDISTSTARRILVVLWHSSVAAQRHLHGIQRYRRTHQTDWTIDLRMVSSLAECEHINLSDGNFDGIITNCPSSLRLSGIIKVPAVFLLGGLSQMKPPKGIPWLATLWVDNQTIIACAMAHLTERGYTSFAYVGIMPDELASRERADAVLRYIAQRRELFAQIYPTPTGAAARDFAVEEKRLGAWLKTLPRKTAVIAGNDVRAEQVLSTCYHAGLRVPEDLVVMGIDNDIDRCQVSSPSISSVSIAFEESGFRAAELLNEYFNASASRAAFITESYASPTVITRESTNERLSSDALVRRALEMINAANGCNITLKSMIETLKVSKASLIAHFHSALGRTPLAEINRVRLAYIQALLRDPAVTRTQISERCGFCSTAHLAYFFRHHTGMTIAAYRATLQTISQESR